MQLHTILHIYYMLNYIHITSILHACNASVITCKLHTNYMQLHAILHENYIHLKCLIINILNFSVIT